MSRRIVISVIVLILVLQTGYLLSADENAKAKVEAIKESVAKAVGTSTSEVVKAAASTEAAAETVAAGGESSAESVEKVATKADAGTKETQEATAKEEAVAATGNDVIATVNGERIFREEFDKRMMVLKRMNQSVTRSDQMQVVNQLTRRVLLKQFVEEQNIDVSDEEIKGELEKIKFFLKSNPNNAERPLEEILEAQGSSISELEDEVRRTLALSKYLDKTVSEDEKKSYFEANKNAFNGEKVKASHVLIDTRKMKTDAELEEAKKKIEVIKKEIDNGADFAEVAKKYSDCPSAEKGGDIGFFQRKGSIVEEFAEVAFSMNVGEVSEPIKTQFGYHIVKVTEKEPGQEVSYDDVADMVDFVYMQIKTENLLKGLFEKAKIDISL